jgi:hypothetical protein
VRGAEDAQAAAAEQVDHAGGQRGLGAHHRQADAFGRGEVRQLDEIGDRHVRQCRVAGAAAVARRDEDLLHLGRLRQLPGQRVLARAAADHEDFHQAWISALV